MDVEGNDWDLMWVEKCMDSWSYGSYQLVTDSIIFENITNHWSKHYKTN